LHGNCITYTLFARTYFILPLQGISSNCNFDDDDDDDDVDVEILMVGDRF